ncbi:MAG: hypothetical protein ACO22R_00420, partial [Chitinophagaceae bacterium]
MKQSTFACLVFACLFSLSSFAQGPRVLVVTAHPDDETGFSVTMFKITKELHGEVDMAVMTDGGGGFADSQLGAVYYGLNLTDSMVARKHLPLIIKQEITNAANIMESNKKTFDQIANKIQISVALQSPKGRIEVAKIMEDKDSCE